MRKYILLYLLAIIGIFVEFSFLGIVGGIIFKVLIFGGISYFLYDIWRHSNEEQGAESRQKESNPITTEVAAESDAVVIDKSTLQAVLARDGTALEFVLNEFAVIWGFIIPNNGYLFIRGADGFLKRLHHKHQSYIQTKLDQRPDMLLNLLDRGQTILLEKDIQPASNLLPFYDEDEYKPRSLLAIKAEITKREALYFLFDSKTPNAFNSEDIPILETINSSIVSVLSKLLEVDGLASALSREQHFLEIANSLNSVEDLDSCIHVMSTILVNQFEASKLTIAFKNDDGNKGATAVIKKAIGIDDPFKSGYEFPLDDGLNGWVISKNKPYLLDNIDKGEYFIPRFTKEEKTNYGIKSFLSVPVRVNDEATGLITLEDTIVNKYSEKDKKQLQDLSRIFAYAVKRFLKTNRDGG
ncbi:MAG TPA: GAF domain-containing protein [Calditrichaeota bacterium]|nr:GAF domain-containing protein [Calditrichota bacterium]